MANFGGGGFGRGGGMNLGGGLLGRGGFGRGGGGMLRGFNGFKGFRGASQQFRAGPARRGAPKVPGAPGAVGAPGAPGAPGTPGLGQPSPLDSTYYANVNQNAFNVGNKINSLNLSNATAGTALQSALAQLAYQQPRSELQLEQKANAGGGLYSSVYGQNLGNLNYQFMGKQGAAIDNYASRAAGNDANIAALQGSIPLYNAGQYAAAALRASTAAQKNPASGEPLGTPGGAKANLAKAIASRAHVNAKGGGKQAPNRSSDRGRGQNLGGLGRGGGHQNLGRGRGGRDRQNLGGR